MNNIVWKRPDGGISFTVLGKEGIELFDPDKSEEENLIDHANLLQSNGSIKKDFEMMPIGTVCPPDLEHRDAWVADGDRIVIDLPKAKEIKKNRLRYERIALFAVQDIAFQRALEANQDTSGIIAEKIRLRDITKMVDAVARVEDLNNVVVTKK